MVGGPLHLLPPSLYTGRFRSATDVLASWLRFLYTYTKWLGNTTLTTAEVFPVEESHVRGGEAPPLLLSSWLRYV